TPGSYVASRLEGAAGLNVQFNRAGAIQFGLGDDFSYSDKTRNLALGVGALSLYNEARAEGDLRPGGRAPDIAPRAPFSFEPVPPLSPLLPPGCTSGDLACDPNAVTRMNYANFRGGLDARWKFLPKTAVVIESNFDARTYTDTGLNTPSLL